MFRGSTHSAPRPSRWALLAALALVLVSSRAGAQDPQRDTARTRLLEGVKLLDRGDFAAALTVFQAVYASSPSPKILYNIGLAYKGVGRFAQAFTAFERFLREASDVSAEYLRHSRQELERLSKRIAFVEVSGDATDPELLLDQESLGRFTLPARIPVDTGPHRLTVRTAEAAQHREFTAVAGRDLLMRFDLRTPAPGPVAAARPADASNVPTTDPALVASPRPRDRSLPPQSTPLDDSGLLCLSVDGGLRLLRFHGRTIDTPLVASGQIRATYLLSAGAARVELGLTAPLGSLPYERVGSGVRATSFLFGALATFGLAYPLGTRWRLAGSVDAGVVWWAGLGAGNPFTVDHQAAAGPVPLPTARAGLAASYALGSEFFLFTRTSASASKTTTTGLTRSISRVSALDLAFGGGATF
jgi:hypothetical protein